MEINSKNLIRHELIGLKVKIKNSRQPSLKGIRGLVIDETMNTLTLQKEDREIIIPKSITQLSFILGKKEVTVDGKIIAGRPEERIKVKKRIWL